MTIQAQTSTPTSAVAQLTGPALLAELDRLRAENLRLQTERARGTAGSISFKVSEKGAVSVYGLGRFPVTLYVAQWERLVSRLNDLQEFLKAHGSELARK
jgi:hypothetical protein